MRILIIAHTSGKGGGTRSLLDVVASLSGHTVFVMIPRSQDQWLPQELASLGAHVIETDLRPPLYLHFNGAPGGLFGLMLFLRALRGDKAYLAALGRSIETLRIDTVAVNSSVLCRLAPVIDSYGAKSLCFVREAFPLRGIKSAIMLKLLDKFDDVAFLSGVDERNADLPNARMHVIHDVFLRDRQEPPSRQDAREHFGLSDDAFTVLFVGGSAWFKGLDTALEAVRRQRDSGAVLLVAGGMFLSQPKSLAGKIKSFFYRDRDAFLRAARRYAPILLSEGRLVDAGMLDDMSLAYMAADVLIFPSRRAHHARPVFEAGAFGLPVIVSDSDLMRAFVDDGHNGIFVAPDDPQSLAEAIDYLARDANRRVTMGRRNRETTTRLHNPATAQALLLAILDQNAV